MSSIGDISLSIVLKGGDTLIRLLFLAATLHWRVCQVIALFAIFTDIAHRAIIAIITQVIAIILIPILRALSLLLDCGAIGNLVLKFVVGRRPEHLVHLEEVGQVLLVGRLVNHDVAGFVVGVAVLDHVWAGVDARVPVDPQVVHEEQHQALVVQEVLESLE